MRKRARQQEEQRGSYPVPPPWQAAAAPEACDEDAQESASSDDEVLQWMLGITGEQFFADYFEKRPLVVHRSDPAYYTGRLDWSTSAMKAAVRVNTLHYSTDINVVRYDKATKMRIPHKTEGIVTLGEMVECMDTGGWSCRFLRPHEHSAPCSALIRRLERCFKCSCGSNSYWTPRGSQGFAPHYDDVDVFLLQLEGEKHWRLYPPPGDVDVLSRHSSEDYEPSQLPPKPTMSIVLKAGDALYMPRGWVHQGHTDASTHSLHITFSACQMHSWADLLLRMTRHQIEVFAANDVEWRRSVPRAWMGSLGAVHNKKIRSEILEMDDSSASSKKVDGPHRPQVGLPPDRARARMHLLKQARDLISQLATALNDAETIDHCVDKYAEDVIARMQPEQSKYSSGTTALADGEDSLNKSIRVANPVGVRLILSVPNEAVVVYAAQNNVVCGAIPVQMLRFEADFAPAIAHILEAYPLAVRVDELPMPAFDDVPDDAKENRRVLSEALAGSHAFHFA